MASRFKDLKPQKTNMFRNKSNTQKRNQNNLKQNNRWSRLDTNEKQENKNKFKSLPTIKTNSRWSNLNSDEKDSKNSFKYRKPEGRFNRERNNNRNYRGRRPRDNTPSIFTDAKMVNGVPQIKGSLQRTFNIMDTIGIKQKPKKKSPKKKKKKKMQLESLNEPKETEEEKRQKELWKQQLIAQYAYEYDTEEEENDGDIDENTE